MNIEKRLVKFYSEKPGYLKKSPLRSLNKLNIPVTETALAICRRVKSSMRKSRYGSTTVSSSKRHTAKILIFDIETAPILAYTWRRFQQNIYSDQTIEDNWPVLTWSAKWLFDNKMYSMKMTPKEAICRDDKRVVEGLWHMINEADIVIAHNGLKFDMRMLNGRFFIHGMRPPSSVQVIDTLKAARRAMALPSFKLDDIAKYLGKEGKIKTDFSWWTKFMEGEKEAIDQMQEYNDKDVYVLEEVYFALRPWIKPHPNLGLFVDHSDQTCPACASTELEKISEYATYVNTYDEYSCKSCGHISRGRQTNTPIGGRLTLNVSVPK